MLGSFLQACARSGGGGRGGGEGGGEAQSEEGESGRTWPDRKIAGMMALPKQQILNKKSTF